MPSLDEIMKMAEAALAQLSQAQDNLDKVEVEGVSGGGLVLTAYKQPRIVEFRSELPKSNVGKILRRELRDSAKVAA